MPLSSGFSPHFAKRDTGQHLQCSCAVPRSSLCNQMVDLPTSPVFLLPMPLSKYQQALGALDHNSKRAVGDVFIAWSSDVALAQVSRNVDGETALAAADFLNLLTSFATELANGNPGE